LVRPYQDDGSVRTFDSSVNSSELVWHRDREDRIVKVLEGKDWYFQFDDQLPFELKYGDQFFIEKMTYHRLIKGSTNLKVLIEKRHG
jgi:quercetin dioxygenase-like cupin family protein